MIPPPRIFAQFLDGRRGSELDIARLPIVWGRRIGALTQNVKIQRAYVNKIKRKHRLTYGHFWLLQPAIDFGMIVYERPRCLTFFLFDRTVYGTTFELVVGATKTGHEIWVKTYHKADPAAVRAAIRNGQVLRHQVG